MSEIATKPKFATAEFKKPQGLEVLKKMGELVKSSVQDAMPAFMRGQAPALLRALYTEVQKTPALANCTPESLFGCTIVAGQMGLMIGSALGQCYIIPFRGRATLVPGYKGYIQLVNRSGQAGVITARTVYDKDICQVEYGSSPTLKHIPGSYDSLEVVRTRKPVGFYATCQTKQGSTFVYLTKAEAEYHKEKFALAKKGPWETHFDAMAMKTCIIKLCKYLPMSAELQTGISIDESHETDEPFDASFMFQETVETGGDSEPAQLPASKVDELKERMASAKAPANGKLFTESQGLPD